MEEKSGRQFFVPLIADSGLNFKLKLKLSKYFFNYLFVYLHMYDTSFYLAIMVSPLK